MNKEKLKDFTDEELIVMQREGLPQAEDYLIDKYKDLVRRKAGTMFILGAERDDLIQEGMIGLFKAIRDFDAGRDACFETFATLCISRQMYTAVQAGNRQKHLPLNSYISLDGDDHDGGIGDISAGRLANPESVLIDAENCDDIRSLIETQLSDLEKQIFDLYLTGMGYAEIARVLDRDVKSTDNALQRAKMKLKKGLNL